MSAMTMLTMIRRHATLPRSVYKRIVLLDIRGGIRNVFHACSWMTSHGRTDGRTLCVTLVSHSLVLFLRCHLEQRRTLAGDETFGFEALHDRPVGVVRQRKHHSPALDLACAVRQPNRKAQIPRQPFPRSILVANVTRTSLTCREEIGRVWRVRESATRMLRGNCYRGI